jgi:tetratricopeptide (TPR) repeat protein
MSHYSTGLASPRFVPGGTMSVNRFGTESVGRVPQTAWRHTQGWSDWGHGQTWYHGHGFYGDRDYYRHNFAFLPFFYPGWYGWYDWPYSYDYGYDTYWPSYYDGGSSGGTAVSYATPTAPTVAQGTTSLGEEYAEQARDAFRNGDYQGALRAAGHAAVEMPRDAAIHELMSLALFALKDYRGAAIEAHAALSLGPPIDWPTLYAYYGSADTYTNQLRALETFVRENPRKPEGQFLLGYHYIMTGNRDAAKKELAGVLAIPPADKLAESLMQQLDKP